MDAKARRRSWAELGIVVLIAIAPLTFNAVGSLLHIRSNVSASANLRVAFSLFQAVSSLLLVVYLLRLQGQSLRSLGLTLDRWTDWPKGLGLALAGLFCSAILSIFVRWVSFHAVGHAAEMRDPRVIFAGISPGWFVIYAIGASIFEETIVRGYVTTRMIALSCPVWLASVTSVALQTSYHVYYGLGGAAAISGVFIVFAFYFARSRRLLPVLLGHLFFDLFAIWSNHLA